MALIDEVERRAELAAKVSMLEERSIQNQKHLDRIEATLLAHATEEENMLRDINKSLRDFTVEVQNKISEAVNPLKEDVSKYKTIIGVVTSALAIIGGFFATFHTEILRWLGIK